MVAVGMEVLKLDPCLFISKRVTAKAFVNGLLFWSTNEAYLNKKAKELQEQGLLHEQEEDAAGNMGVQMTKITKRFHEMK